VWCAQTESDDSVQAIAQWWGDFQDKDEAGRKLLVDELPRAPRKRRRSRKKSKPGTSSSSPTNAS